MPGKGKRNRPGRHTESLAQQIENPAENGLRIAARTKRMKSEDPLEPALDEKLSSRIVRVSREQLEEIDAEDRLLPSDIKYTDVLEETNARSASDSESEIDEGYLEATWEEEADIMVEDEAALAAFQHLPAEGSPQNLADIILAKIKEKQDRAASGMAGGETASPAQLDEKVVAVYKGVGQIMKRFTTGKVPKAFKLIPNLQNWEEIVYLTEPEAWSPHTMYQATKMFVSSMKAKLAQRFLALILLPAVRQDIRDNKRLHFALFQAMKKATYKPDAFFKGLLLPLCSSATCTLREAVIVSSVLNRVSIPVVHSAAALMRLADMPYQGTTSFFIRVLLDKKYSLPYRTVDALVDHFLGFRQEERALPVVWHQALLVFVQRYKHEIRKEDQEQLRKLVKVQYHYQVSPEVYRELEAARSRGEKAKPAESATPVVGKQIEDLRQMAPVLILEE